MIYDYNELLYRCKAMRVLIQKSTINACLLGKYYVYHPNGVPQEKKADVDQQPQPPQSTALTTSNSRPQNQIKQANIQRGEEATGGEEQEPNEDSGDQQSTQLYSVVHIQKRDLIAASKDTKLYRDDHVYTFSNNNSSNKNKSNATPESKSDRAKILVIEGDCVEAALWLQNSQGCNPCVLNMASRNNPG